ncbi:hypothetical protein RB195_013341 [Necator americanus]|uniref:RNA helicase n=1 Tax=Necator americanus TaxID=51031 RepID=A0ABR1DV26_NECAM
MDMGMVTLAAQEPPHRESSRLAATSVVSPNYNEIISTSVYEMLYKFRTGGVKTGNAKHKEDRKMAKNWGSFTIEPTVQTCATGPHSSSSAVGLKTLTTAPHRAHDRLWAAGCRSSPSFHIIMAHQPVPSYAPSCFALPADAISTEDMCRTVEGAIEYRKKIERFRDCKEIVRDLYKKPPTAPNYTAQQLEAVYASMQNMKVYRHNEESTADIPPPFLSFDEAFQDYPSILRELKKQSFTAPSPIQAQLWPALLKGNDCIGVSETGSGKTLGFLLPAFLHIEAQHGLYETGEKKPCPSVLVLTPTRELAQQIDREVKKYSYNGYKSVCLYGGVARLDQMKVCRSGVEIVIATPGRLADLADEGVISLATVSYLVLDEADRMLDLGFEPSIRRILCEIRPDRIIALTSATWPENVRQLAKKYTKDAIMVVVGSLNLTACSAVKQYFEFWEGSQKFDRLREIVHYLLHMHGPRFKMIIFVKAKAMVDFISSELCKCGIPAQGMHGGRSQLDRENVFRELRLGQCQILVATDLVSRGIHIADITHVLNYDFPGDIEEYVHRVGRTGRAGRTGEAMTFISWCDRMHAARLIALLEESKQHVPPALRRLAARHAERVAKLGPLPPRRYRRNKQDDIN